MGKNLTKAQLKAHEIKSDLENCMSDLAYNELGYFDDAKAEEIWNDPNVLLDLLGDRVYCECKGYKTDDDEIFGWEILDHIIVIGHKALKIAAFQLKERRGFI